MILLLCSHAQLLQAQDSFQRPAHRKLWWISVSALIAANILDGASSSGAYEANPLLRDSQGRFSLGKATAVKSSVWGTALLVEWLVIRKSPQKEFGRPIAAINFGAAGVVAGASLKNFQLGSKPIEEIHGLSQGADPTTQLSAIR